MKLRAFVSHSFSEGDEHLISEFDRFFRALERSVFDFSWLTAEAAEPRPPPEKVIELMTGRDILIAICTAKERVATKELRSNRLFPDWLFGRKGEFEWKTSDWITQEIGYAAGKEMKLVLLLEKGVRPPGGIKGGHEYIPFERDYAARAYPKIVEIMGKIAKDLTPTAEPVSMTVAVEPTTTTPAVEAVDKSDVDWSEPPEGWSRGTYEHALVHLTLGERDADAVSLHTAYRKSGLAMQDDNEIRWQAIAEYARIRTGKAGAISNLRILAEQNPTSSGAAEYLARGLERYSDHKGAADIFVKAAESATTDEEAIRLLGRAALGYQRKGLTTASAQTLSRMRQRAKTDGDRKVLLLSLRESTLLAKDDLASRALLERIVELDASDGDSRWKLAHEHSESDGADLSLFHYSRIPVEDRSSATWNNLGVAYDSFAMPSKAVLAFSEAEHLGESLASTNLAGKLISAGFLEEAKKRCDIARKAESPPHNLAQTLERLTDVPTEEDEHEIEVLTKAKRKSEFLAGFGRALIEMPPTTIGANWSGPVCKLEVRITGNEFFATGSFESAIGGLTLALLGSTQGIGTAQVERVVIEYRGKIDGRTIRADTTRNDRGLQSSQSLLGSALNEKHALMILSDDGLEIKVMELSATGDATFYALRQMPGSSP